MLSGLLITIDILVCICLVAVVLLQRSEGGAFGSGGGPTGLVTARGAGDLLTRTTWVLFAVFLVLSAGLMLLGVHDKASGTSLSQGLKGAVANSNALPPVQTTPSPLLTPPGPLTNSPTPIGPSLFGGPGQTPLSAPQGTPLTTPQTTPAPAATPKPHATHLAAPKAKPSASEAATPATQAPPPPVLLAPPPKSESGSGSSQGGGSSGAGGGTTP